MATSVSSLPAPGGTRAHIFWALLPGLALAGLFWVAFTGPFSIDDLCGKNRLTWIIPLFVQAKYTAMNGRTFLEVMAIASVLYAGGVWLARGLRGPWAASLLVGLVPLLLAAVLVPAYPLLSSDVYKYIFDGRILTVYGENPFLHVPAEFPDDRFYDLVYWKAVVNAHGPLWRLAEAASAGVGGESCENSVWAMKAWPTLAYLGTTGLLYTLLRVWRPERAIWGTLLYAWNPVVLLEAVQNGHNDVVAALPAVLAVWLAIQGRVRWAFPLLAVAALVKPIALALGPLLLIAAVRRLGQAPEDERGRVDPRQAVRQPALWVGIGLAAALVVLAYLPFWDGPSTLGGLKRENLFATSPADGLLQLLDFLDVPLAQALVIASGMATGLFALLAVRIVWASWAGRLPVLAAALGIFYVYLLVGAQWFNPWYFLWLAPFVALVSDRAPRLLGLAFMLLAPITYPVRDALPVLLVVFLPAALLAVYWRAWLGWAGPAGAAADVATPDLDNLQTARAGVTADR